jgi:hypothetical protein
MTGKVDAALIEKRRRGQTRWYASMTDEQRAAWKAKLQAGRKRYLEGKARLEREAAERRGERE